MKKKRIFIIIIFAVVFIILAGLTKSGYIPNFLNLEILYSEDKSDLNSPYFQYNWEDETFDKPVIYLYPTHKQDIEVKLEYKWKIIADYPDYNDQIKGREVTAYPDGKIINKIDKQEYNYIFWEGLTKEKINRDFSKWFVIKGEDTKKFLQQKLSEIGLTPREYNEFIVYWYPLMQNNKYNIIHFADKQYTNIAPLTISPKPDSILRIFMVYKPSEEIIPIEEQEIKPFQRKWFTVIEWWGTKIE